MKKKYICIIAVAFVILITFSLGVLFAKTNNSFKTSDVIYNYESSVKSNEKTIFCSYSCDVEDLRSLVGNADYVFVGKIESNDGYCYENPIEKETEDGNILLYDTYTNYSVKVITNIKGKLKESSSISIKKWGGLDYYNDFYHVVENDVLPENGNTYIFTAYVQVDGTLLVSGAYSNIPLDEENGEQQIKAFKKAYKYEEKFNRKRYSIK